jgi:hypothetical protein
MTSKPFPDPSHECAGSGEPILDAWTHQAIRFYPGATAEEITEKVLNIAGWKDAYDRRTAALRVREIMGMPQPAERPSGHEWVAIVRAYKTVRARHPGQLPTQEQVGAARSIAEDTLAKRLRPLGVRRWPDVHTLVESEPET